MDGKGIYYYNIGDREMGDYLNDLKTCDSFLLWKSERKKLIIINNILQSHLINKNIIQ